MHRSWRRQCLAAGGVAVWERGIVLFRGRSTGHALKCPRHVHVLSYRPQVAQPRWMRRLSWVSTVFRDGWRALCLQGACVQGVFVASGMWAARLLAVGWGWWWALVHGRGVAMCGVWISQTCIWAIQSVFVVKGRSVALAVVLREYLLPRVELACIVHVPLCFCPFDSSMARGRAISSGEMR